MRKLILILWAGILSVFSISCYDDEGSNDYHSINEVKISDWKKGGYTAIFKSDTLKITPLSYLDTVRKEVILRVMNTNGKWWPAVRPMTGIKESFWVRNGI